MGNTLEKIVVNKNEELIDIVRKISQTKAQRILLTFAEDSEILISSINLKVLQDSADEKESLLILQIPNNSTGVRNAKLAGINVIDSPTTPTQQDWDTAQQEYEKRYLKLTKTSKVIPEEYKSENITSFEQRVNSVLDRNKEERSNKGNLSRVEDSDTDIVIDQDISTPTDESKLPEQEDLTKVDFKSVPDPIRNKAKKKFELPKLDFLKGKSNNSATKKVTGNSKEISNKFVKLLPKILIPLIVVVFLVAFLYFKMAPYVKVTLYVQSKPVEVEQIFTGDENIKEIDFENYKIPIKTETASKSVSDTVNATGSAFRGDKATGSVTISYINPAGCEETDAPVSVSVGHQIETQGKKYKLTGDLTITCNDYGTVGVEAIEVGEEYNIPSGKYFSVDGFDSSKVYAVNSGAFTGGSKEQYTVLSQADVNTKVEELEELAKSEAESELNSIGNGWELIESTLESKVKEGSIDTSVSIGAEANSADISLEVESSATYYYSSGVDDGLNDLLTQAALNQNLFENNEGLELSLTGDIEKELTVIENEDEVQIKLVASSSVEPSVNRENIINDLRGLKWEDGLKYINDLTFTSKDAIVVFNPTNFPEKLRSFPSRQGRIDVIINQDITE